MIFHRPLSSYQLTWFGGTHANQLNTSVGKIVAPCELTISGITLIPAFASTPVRSNIWTPIDEFFGPACIDIDEWRDKPEPHRYVHGGFADTDTRFSCDFPPKERYRGRFIQYLQRGSGGNEDNLSGTPEHLLNGWELGGYMVESNQGHIGADMSYLEKGGPTIGARRANVESPPRGRGRQSNWAHAGVDCKSVGVAAAQV